MYDAAIVVGIIQSPPPPKKRGANANCVARSVVIIVRVQVIIIAACGARELEHAYDACKSKLI